MFILYFITLKRHDENEYYKKNFSPLLKQEKANKFIHLIMRNIRFYVVRCNEKIIRYNNAINHTFVVMTEVMTFNFSVRTIMKKVPSCAKFIQSP